MNILKVFFPAFVQNEQREESITFYEELFDEPCNLRFLYPEGGLKLATVASVLLVAGSDAA